MSQTVERGTLPTPNHPNRLQQADALHESAEGTSRARRGTPTIPLEQLMIYHVPFDLSGQVRIPDRGNPAQGGLADVHAGLWGDRPVAVKVLRIRKSRRADADWEASNERRLAREMRVWAALKHPNICEFLGYSTDFSDYPAMISMWCERGTATEHLESQTWSVSERIRLTQDVGKGLHYLHGLKIIHGDLKPSNVLVDGDCVARLCDFGLVRLADWEGPAGLTTTTPYTGTQRYKAPELFMSSDNRHPIATFEGDIYSFGCILLEFIEQIYPFRRFRKAYELTNAIIEGCSPALRSEGTQVLSNMNESYWELIESCWGEPDSRPSVGIIMDALNNFARSMSRKLPSLGPSPPPRPAISPEKLFELNSPSNLTGQIVIREFRGRHSFIVKDMWGGKPVTVKMPRDQPSASRHAADGYDGEKATTPTQSNTLAQAKQQQDDARPGLELNTADFGSLTPEQIAQLQANMLDEIHDADARPLISQVQPMEVLTAEYSSNPNFVRKMEWLKREGWLGVRRTKGDGDCFYRSFAFAWVERILRARDRELAVAAAISNLHTTWIGFGEVGFDTEILADCYEVLNSLVRQVIISEPDGKTLNASLLLEAFTSVEASNSIVVYVRMVTSAELRKNQDEYAAFVVHPETQESMPVPEFCNHFVDGMGREADHVQMEALAKAMGVNLSVVYLDGKLGNGDAVDFVKFENGGGNEATGIEDVVLLYRPGHYDILEHRAHEHRGSAASPLVTPSVME